MRVSSEALDLAAVAAVAVWTAPPAVLDSKKAVLEAVRLGARLGEA